MQLSQNFYKSHKKGAFKIKHKEMRVHMTSYLLHRAWTSRSDTQKQSKQSQWAKGSFKANADRAFSPLLPKWWRWSCCHTSFAGRPQPETETRCLRTWEFVSLQVRAKFTQKEKLLGLMQLQTRPGPPGPSAALYSYRAWTHLPCIIPSGWGLVQDFKQHSSKTDTAFP